MLRSVKSETNHANHAGYRRRRVNCRQGISAPTGRSAGQVVSKLLRTALTGEASAQRPGAAVLAGFRPFAASDQQLVSNEQIYQLRDLEGS